MTVVSVMVYYMFLKKTTMGRLLAVPFQSVEGASESRKQARRDWSERTSRGETGERREKKELSFVTDAFEFPAASGTENSDWFIDNRKLSRKFDEYWLSWHIKLELTSPVSRWLPRVFAARIKCWRQFVCSPRQFNFERRTEVSCWSASVIKRCHGCATDRLRKSIIFQSFVSFQNFGNASVVVYIVPEPENHWCLQVGNFII